MEESLTGKVALVTGATKGIGFAIARMLAAEGVHLALNARSENDLIATKAELLSKKTDCGEILLFPGSVGKHDIVKQMIEETIRHFGRLDIVINNAGISPPFVLMQELSIDALDDTIDVNLKGPLYTMKYALAQMVHQGGGYIININSIAGKTAYPYSSVYCASKWGLKALTDCVCGEQRTNNNIKVIGIYPGEVHTPIWDSIEPHKQQDPDHMLAPEDVAQAVHYVLTQPNKTLIQDITLVPQEPPPH